MGMSGKGRRERKGRIEEEKRKNKAGNSQKQEGRETRKGLYKVTFLEGGEIN